MMKRYATLFVMALGLSALVASSCSKSQKEDPEPEPSDGRPELIADRTEIMADGVDCVNFTVMLDGVDITSEEGVTICSSAGLCMIPFGGKFSFSTKIPGEYDFTASYLGQESLPVTVTVVPDQSENPDPSTFDPSKEFHKNVLFTAFTATWCGTCYGKYKNPMAEYLQDETHADHIIQMDIHVEDEIDNTQLSYDLIADLDADGRWSVRTLPGIIVDFRREFTNPSDDWIYCMGFSPLTAISAESSYNGGSATVNVSLGVKEAGEYRLVAALLEDNIIAYQSSYGEGYNHNNVLRAISDGGIFGDGDITMDAGEEIQRSFSFDVDESLCNVSNLAVVIYSLRYEDGVIVADNSIRLQLGKSLDYRYE